VDGERIKAGSVVIIINWSRTASPAVSLADQRPDETFSLRNR
jgi:hypothetical protein